MLYNTLPGSGESFAYTTVATPIAVDASGNAYATGMTSSADFPVTAGAVQTVLAGPQNVFVAKLDAGGNRVYETFLGGSGFDQGLAIQVDAAGNISLAGTTTSLDFPTTVGAYLAQALMPPRLAVPGGFAAKISPAGALLYSTYIVGGMASDGTYAVLNMIPDPFGGAYVAGVSGPGLAVTLSAIQTPAFRSGWHLH